MFLRSCIFFLICLMFIAFGGVQKVVIAQPTAGLDDLVEPGAPERIATGFGNTEGPVWHPDGMKVDINGNLYVTTNMPFVQIFDSAGKHLGNIVTPEITRNCAFGGPDNKTLFITALTSVYRVQLKVRGVPVTAVTLVRPLVSTWGRLKSRLIF